MPLAALLAALAATAAAATGDGPPDAPRALVLAEGTQEEAERWGEHWAEVAEHLAAIIRPAQGYPRAVPAEGGRHLAVLGVCKAADLPARLELVRALFPQARAQAAPGLAEACPSLPAEARLRATAIAEPTRTTRLVGALFLRQPGPGEDRARRTPHDPEAGIWHLEVVLFRDGEPKRAKRRLYRSLPDALAGRSRCTLVLAGQKTVLRLEATCDEELDPADSICGRTGKAHLSEVTEYGLVSGTFEDKTTLRKRTEPPPCPGPTGQ